MNTSNKLNMTMLCDFYELTMGNGYFKAGYKDRITHFDLYFRSVPDKGGYAIAAGLEQVIDYLRDLHFDPEDIQYLRDRKIFDEAFLEYLANFKFTGDIYAIPEGTPVFPHEPILTVRAPAIQTQLLETYLLLTINHQSLIATKANRIVRAAKGRTVLEFGSRRAQGSSGAIDGARAAFIGGCNGTACTISDQLYGVPAGGTMAHAWVRYHDAEFEAFKGLPDLLRGLPRKRRPAGGYLQYPEERHPRRHPSLQRRAQAPGHHQVRDSPGLRRYGLPDQGGPPYAGRGRLDRVQDYRVQLSG